MLLQFAANGFIYYLKEEKRLYGEMLILFSAVVHVCQGHESFEISQFKSIWFLGSKLIHFL